MNEISNIVGQVIDALQKGLDSGGLRVRDLPKIINDSGGEYVNLYPSDTKGICHKLALFIASKHSAFAKGNGHLTCRQAMEKLIQHMQGPCEGVTEKAIFITAYWDAAAYQEWKYLLADIGRKVDLEVLLLAGDSATIIDISISKT